MKLLVLLGLIWPHLLWEANVWSTATDDLVNKPGHLKPFGFSDHHLTIDEREGFSYPKEFIQKYVRGSQPVLMKGAGKQSRAFTVWTDDYFLSVDEPADHMVMIEGTKKENRSVIPVHMSFKAFIKVYNTTDQYLVNSVPHFIRQDVLVPGPLQCEAFRKFIVDSIVWFSSGGTKSVVHLDSVDNINCLYRGTKTLIMVDPHKYGNNVDLDHPEGAYSDIDVDEVDFTKYPGLADVQYYKIDMVPGDCVYIPYKWIHQVRSFGSNVAVNVWWDHHKGKNVDLDLCPNIFDPDYTLDKVEMSDFENMDVGNATKDHFLEHAKKGALDFQGLVTLITSSIKHFKEFDLGDGYKIPLREVFNLLDHDKNNLMTDTEIMEASGEEWLHVTRHIGEFNDIIEGYIEQLAKEYADNKEDEQRNVDKQEL